jgi:hypothetical protein
VPIMLKWSLIKAITAIINKEVNKEPASKLIDKRFANVKDWKKLEIIRITTARTALKPFEYKQCQN